MYKANYNNIHVSDLMYLQDILAVKIQENFKPLKNKPGMEDIQNALDDCIEILYERQFNI